MIPAYNESLANNCDHRCERCVKYEGACPWGRAAPTWITRAEMPWLFGDDVCVYDFHDPTKVVRRLDENRTT